MARVGGGIPRRKKHFLPQEKKNAFFPRRKKHTLPQEKKHLLPHGRKKHVLPQEKKNTFFPRRKKTPSSPEKKTPSFPRRKNTFLPPEKGYTDTPAVCSVAKALHIPVFVPHWSNVRTSFAGSSSCSDARERFLPSFDDDDAIAEDNANR